MALDPLSVSIVLDTLVCRDEGQDPGTNAEPYLWTLFFKVDGATATLSDPDITLAGTALTRATPGSHGNLGTTNVNTGDRVPIPATIGRWQTTLTAIPVAPAFQQLGGPDRIAGAVGVVLVLMEHDWTSDNAAEAGHQALNTKLRAELNRIVDGLGLAHPEVTQGDIDAVAAKVRSAVTAAIQVEGGILQDLANLVNADDFLGADAVIVTHSELERTPNQPFSRRFRPRDRGDWEIRGRAVATPVAANSTLAAGTPART